MEEKQSKRRSGSTRNLLASIGRLIDSLPTEEERSALRADLAAVHAFLSSLEEAVAGLPTKEDAAFVRQSLERLQRVAATAAERPLLGAALGSRARTPKTERGPTEEELTRAGQLLTELEASPVDEIHERLGQTDAVSVHVLRAIAGQLGIRATARLTKEALAHQIASSIANKRGYEGLRQPQAE